jgi:hypothetical protein
MKPLRHAASFVLLTLVIASAPYGRTASEPFEPAPILIDGAPPPRKIAEVQAILGSALTAPQNRNAKPIRIVLCASEKDRAHNRPGIHDYPLWRERWSRLLSRAPGVIVETATDWPTPEQWSNADVIAINSHNPAWSLGNDLEKVAILGAQMDGFLARGGGLAFIHWSVNGGPHAPDLATRLGLAWETGSRYRHGAKDWILDLNHPLAAGFKQWEIPDESYWNLTGDLGHAKGSVLASSIEENEPRAQMWTREAGHGRIFVSIPGHYSWTFDDPLYRILVFRGLMWVARQPIDRLAPLTIVGARVE